MKTVGAAAGLTDAQRGKLHDQLCRGLVEQCAICHDVMDEPVITKACQHVYCRPCINVSLQVRAPSVLDT